MLRSHERAPRANSGMRLIRSGPACSSCSTKLKICMMFTTMLKDEPISFLYGNSVSPSQSASRTNARCVLAVGVALLQTLYKIWSALWFRSLSPFVQTALSRLEYGRWRPSLAFLMPHHRLRFGICLGVHSSHLFRLTISALSTTTVLPSG
jgi:hypothetical protein